MSGFDDPALEHTPGYDLSRIPDSDSWQTRYQSESDAVLDALEARLDIPYADKDPRQCLDVFPGPTAEQSKAAILFFHGGYWQFGSKNSRRFPAAAFHEHGIAWVPANYRLTPAVELAECVADARAAATWLYRNAEGFGIDPSRIVVAGNSAGGHLTAMILAGGWRRPYGLPEAAFDRGCPISGLYDLAPLCATPENEALRLDADGAARLSPRYQPPPPTSARITVAWGDSETAAFEAQSRGYLATLQAHGIAAGALALSGHDHFSVIGEIGRTDRALFKALVSLAEA